MLTCVSLCFGPRNDRGVRGYVPRTRDSVRKSDVFQAMGGVEPVSGGERMACACRVRRRMAAEEDKSRWGAVAVAPSCAGGGSTAPRGVAQVRLFDHRCHGLCRSRPRIEPRPSAERSDQAAHQ